MASVVASPVSAIYFNQWHLTAQSYNLNKKCQTYPVALAKSMVAPRLKRHLMPVTSIKQYQLVGAGFPHVLWMK